MIYIHNIHPTIIKGVPKAQIRLQPVSVGGSYLQTATFVRNPKVTRSIELSFQISKLFRIGIDTKIVEESLIDF